MTIAERPDPDANVIGGTYGDYLRLNELLSLQTRLSDPPAHEEMLWIVVHQAQELWFKEIVFELEVVRDLLFRDAPARACSLLRRVHAAQRALRAQLEVFEHMTPKQMRDFPLLLGFLSGFQSVQFRELEFLSGLKDASFAQQPQLSADARAMLKRRLDEPSLWDAFVAFLDGRSLPMPTDDPETCRRTLFAILDEDDRYPDEARVAEELLTYDELFLDWRHRHTLAVERVIGLQSSPGRVNASPYLRKTLTKRFFPALWDVRTSFRGYAD